MKRLFDLTIVLVSIAILFPLIFTIWLMIRIESGSPGFFKQQRVGKDGKTFLLYKFRSMTVKKSVEQGTFDIGSTVRVTSLGKILRKWKIDELPQLWNVVKGDMSIIGPRPEVQKWVDVYPERWLKVLTVLPGITDPASIEFRNEEEMLSESEDPEAMYRDVILPQKLLLNEQYIENQSFIGDLWLIWQTVIKVVKR